MLKKGKKPEEYKETASDNIREKQPPTPISRSETLADNTVIGEKISIEGNIRGKEHLIVEGSMNGNIEMEKHNFTVGSKGRVEGEINAHNVKVSGQMVGNISTKGKVKITKEADFIGDIKAKSISVEDGAYFKGSIELDMEPHRKAAMAGKSTTISNPQSANQQKAQLSQEGKKEI